MNLALDRKTEKLIEKRVRDGQYQSPEDVVQAALGSLIAQEKFGDFEPGELDRLLAQGERSIRKQGTLDAKVALRRRRQRRARLRGPTR